jgi:hypothetical protein
MTPTKSTPKKRRDWRPAFLAAFEQTGMITAAAKAAKIHRDTAYRERQRNEDFALAWAEIEEHTTELMEAEAVRRGVEGVERPVFQGGVEVGTIRQYSDTLLIFMLKSRKPHVYRDNVQVEHRGEIKHEISGEFDAEIERLMAQLADPGEDPPADSSPG